MEYAGFVKSRSAQECAGPVRRERETAPAHPAFRLSPGSSLSLSSIPVLLLPALHMGAEAFGGFRRPGTLFLSAAGDNFQFLDKTLDLCHFRE